MHKISLYFFKIFIITINFYSSYAYGKKIILPEMFKEADDGIVLEYEKGSQKPRIVNYKIFIRKYFFDKNNNLTYFLHYSLAEILIYKVVFFNNKEFIVYYYNNYEWIRKIEYYKSNGEKVITFIRPMKNAYSITYDKKGNIISEFEY